MLLIDEQVRYLGANKCRFDYGFVLQFFLFFFLFFFLNYFINEYVFFRLVAINEDICISAWTNTLFALAESNKSATGP